MNVLNRIPGRVARPASLRWNLIKTLTQSLAMWTVFFFLLPSAIDRLEARTPLARWRYGARRWRVTGVLLFLAGWVPASASATTMVVHGWGTPFPADAPRRLVIAGPYRYVRNPMAMASFAQGLGVALYRGSPLVAAYVVAGMLGWNYLVRPWEEFDLERRFGAPYARYRDGVRCWLPRRHPYTAETLT